MGGLWALEPATEAKHRLYKRYLDAWWPIMLQRAHVSRVTYVDAFAGPGEYVDGQEGSPIFALDRLLSHVARPRMNLTRQRVTLIFIEENQKRRDHLEALLEKRFGALDELPVTVRVEKGRAERDTLPLLDETNAWGSPILAVFDSWGNVGVPWVDLRKIASNPSSENIVTFGPNWFSRRENQEPEKLDLIFGGPQYWQPSNDDLTSTDRWREWLETYRGALKRAGHEYALTFQVMPRTGQPLYLVYGTGHPSGVKAFKDAMWKVDVSDGMRFNDPRTTAGKQAAMADLQPSLFDAPDDVPDPELLGFVDDLMDKPGTSVQDVCDFLIRETSRWRETDARPAIRHLLEEGRIARNPAKGHLTSTTRLRRVT
ncbi:three-Cys-motif partner protein TcmP [Nocardioides kribbensis]|uniref:three-Cys-motif partner protein TcmP n=1 Tax=Nocardioides kribbensis TaxID=305517 RepID=UPI00187A3FAF|nr:three-Cys-motif partner protein TcmP [Nocardioides kribbensis]